MWKKHHEINREKREIKLSPEEIRQKTFDRAVNLLTYKARSVNELRERLAEKDWADEEIIEEVIEKLKYYNYLNDEQFAKNTASAKLRQKPIGKRLLRQQLAQKNLDRETIENALELTFQENSEADLIELAIAKRLRLKGRPETREEQKKLFDFLLRQGFDYDLILNKIRNL